jgi:hypothetical protein
MSEEAMFEEPTFEEPTFEEPSFPPEEPQPERPQVTFRGNSYDLISLGAVASAAILLLMCFTCNMGFYCLPFIPLLLGIIGLLVAKDSVDEERTRLLSWIGVGSGGVVLVLGTLAVLAYFAFIFVVVLASTGNGY